MTMTSSAASDGAGSAVVSSFREMLPRIYELKAMLSDPSHPDAYFQDFEDGLEKYKTKLNAFVTLERQLVVLDVEAWSDLKERAAVHLVSQIRGQGRGWQPLFDIFSEARGFGYLLSIGYTGVHFITRTKAKTPDLGAVRDGSSVLCEVKTLNVSQDEAEKRQRIGKGEIVASSTSIHVGGGFLGKLTATLEHAVEQLDGRDPERKAQRMIFTVVHFDDWVGDYQPEYFAEMDEHLLRNRVAGAELVFCPASNLFERTFKMRSATVLPE